MTATMTTGRKKSSRTETELAFLERVARLAGQILACVRVQGRGRWNSERQLRQWLVEDGIPHTIAEIAPALTLLESGGFIERAPVEGNKTRAGWLTGAPTDTERAAPLALERAIMAATATSNSRERCTIANLPQRLTDNGITFTDDQLWDAITVLIDTGRLLRSQHQHMGDIYLTERAFRGYDPLAGPAAAICRVLKDHGEHFDSDAELQGWLSEAGVPFEESDYRFAMEHLEQIGRLVRPRADQWRFDSPLPGEYAPARIIHE